LEQISRRLTATYNARDEDLGELEAFLCHLTHRRHLTPTQRARLLKPLPGLSGHTIIADRSLMELWQQARAPIENYARQVVAKAQGKITADRLISALIHRFGLAQQAEDQYLNLDD